MPRRSTNLTFAPLSRVQRVRRIAWLAATVLAWGCACQSSTAADAGLPLLPPTRPVAVNDASAASPNAATPAAATPRAEHPATAALSPGITDAAGAPELPPPPALEQNFRPRPPRDVFEAQIALMRDSICPGSIDGIVGTQTRNALQAFQLRYGLRVTGMLDDDTRAMLFLREPPLTTYTITADDVSRLRPWPEGWEAKSRLDRMDHSTVLELVAEKSWTHPKMIERLNPQISDWTRVAAGTVVAMPRVARQQPSTRPMRIVISLSHKILQLYDGESRLLAHFPCSIARRVEKRPVGRLEVVKTAPHPNYTFDPANFPDSEEAQRIGRKLILQPGPNNPVGLAWIGLNRSGYGIHGSPEPEKIGRTESAGCFRLSNWNAEYLLPLVYPGLAVEVEP